MVGDEGRDEGRDDGGDEGEKSKENDEGSKSEELEIVRVIEDMYGVTLLMLKWLDEDQEETVAAVFATNRLLLLNSNWEAGWNACVEG